MAGADGVEGVGRRERSEYMTLTNELAGIMMHLRVLFSRTASCIIGI